jgi:hypothetical protein
MSPAPHPGERRPAASPISYADRVTNLFANIASRSVNHGHRRAMFSVRDRAFILRPIEQLLLENADHDVDEIERALSSSSQSATSDALDRFLDHRMTLVPAIAAILRDREASDRL